MAEKVFYAIVTQWDLDPKKPRTFDDAQPMGPLLFECYLDDEHKVEENVQRRAQGFRQYGWTRVAKVIVDIPEE